MVQLLDIVHGVKQEKCLQMEEGFQCQWVHLFILTVIDYVAGFTTDGRPIVHDPAKSNGYSYVYNKTSIISILV